MNRSAADGHAAVCGSAMAAFRLACAPMTAKTPKAAPGAILAVLFTGVLIGVAP
jgi:hypothetical protein